VQTNHTLRYETPTTGQICGEIWRPHNKSATTRPAGLLHPLPIPDKRGDSVTMDFVGPLPVDKGYCILTMTDRLGADV
jgi:hypothetical protein